MPASPSVSPPVSEVLAAAVRKLLRPLVRLCLSHGLKYQQVAEVLKAAYVEGARAEQPGARPNVSQLSVATGIHRKDINRLLAMPPGLASLPASLEAEVFTRWIADPAYCDAEGRPLALARQSATAGLPSFESLTRAVTVDVHPRAVLDAMLRLRLVDEGGDGSVRLRVSAFVPAPEERRMLTFLADNVRDHLAAAVSNVLRAPGGFLEQSVYGDGLSEASIERLHALSRGHWDRILREVARLAQELERADREAPTADRRFRVGLYFYTEPSPAEPEAGHALPPAAPASRRARDI